MFPFVHTALCSMLVALLFVGGCTTTPRDNRDFTNQCRALRDEVLAVNEKIVHEEDLQKDLTRLLRLPPTNHDAILALNRAEHEHAALAAQLHNVSWETIRSLDIAAVPSSINVPSSRTIRHARSNLAALRVALRAVARANDELLTFLSPESRAEIIHIHRQR